jgi:hypothetical protein
VRQADAALGQRRGTEGIVRRAELMWPVPRTWRFPLHIIARTWHDARRAVLLLVIAVGALGPARAARAADTVIGLDADGAIPVNSQRLLGGGGGFGVRIGSQLHLPLLRIAGEIGYGYERLFADQAPADWSTHRALIGGRIGVGELLVPFVFSHVGYGWRTTTDGSYGGNGVAFDAGLGLDLNLGIVAAGVHAGYATIDAQPVNPQWVILGLDGSVVF